MPEISFGRLPNPPDERDANFPARALLPKTAVELPDFKYWARTSNVLYQDGIGACMGFTGAHLRRTSPVRRTYTYASKDIDMVFPGEDAFNLHAIFKCQKGDLIAEDKLGYYYYALCKERDLYDGSGTYGRVLCKVLREEGAIGSYLWAANAQDATEWVLLRGPMMIGVNWYSDMSKPDDRGVIHLGGNPVGGHELLVRGYNRKTGMYRLTNSWDETWEGSQKGECWMLADELHFLLFEDGGDAICPSEIPASDVLHWNS